MSVESITSTTFSGKTFLSYLNELRGLLGEKTVLMLLRKSGWLPDLRAIVSTRHEKVAPSEALVAINLNIEEIFGANALKTIIYSAAKLSFRSSFGDTAVVREASQWIQTHPQNPMRLRASIETIIYMLEATSSQRIRLEESSSHYHVIIEDCIACYGQKDREPRYCYYNVGMIRGGLALLFGRDDYPVQEISCCAGGDAHCEFGVRKFPFSDNERGSGKTGFLSLPSHLK